MRTLNTIDSCRLDDFFVGVEMDVHEDLGMHSYFTSCMTEIDFPTCIYITKTPDQTLLIHVGGSRHDTNCMTESRLLCSSKE